MTKEPDSPLFRVARTALETGKIAALNEGMDEEIDVLVIVRARQPSGEGSNVSSISTMEPFDHAELLVQGLQSFADMADIPIRVMYLGEERNQG